MKPLLLLALALLPACTQAKPVPPARPALWKVVDADTTIYLFGTIHLLPKGLEWSGGRVARAMAASQQLMLEVVLDKNQAELVQVMTRLGISPGLPPLLDRVAPAKRAALSKVIARSGLPAAYLDKLETWAAALALSSASLQALGLDTADGAEAKLTQAFRAANKPVAGLETIEQQLGYFDALPEAAQRRFLESVADDDSDAKKEFAAMIAAWRAGNVRRIALTFDDELKMSPELTDALLRRRNNNWAQWVATRMAKPGTVFMAVGAGHLAGAGSVEALVAKRGYRVVRVQ